MSKVEIKHIKRTPAFARELEGLIAELEEKMSVRDTQRLIEILRRNTTDSACMVNAGDDEPVFVLKAKDVTSDKVVDYWCELQIEKGLKLARRVPAQTVRPGDDVQVGAELVVESTIPAKVHDARVCAEEMRHYPGRKVAD